MLKIYELLKYTHLKETFINELPSTIDGYIISVINLLV